MEELGIRPEDFPLMAEQAISVRGPVGGLKGWMRKTSETSTGWPAAMAGTDCRPPEKERYREAALALLRRKACGPIRHSAPHAGSAKPKHDRKKGKTGKIPSGACSHPSIIWNETGLHVDSQPFMNMCPPSVPRHLSHFVTYL